MAAPHSAAAMESQDQSAPVQVSDAVHSGTSQLLRSSSFIDGGQLLREYQLHCWWPGIMICCSLPSQGSLMVHPAGKRPCTSEAHSHANTCSTLWPSALPCIAVRPCCSVLLEPIWLTALVSCETLIKCAVYLQMLLLTSACFDIGLRSMQSITFKITLDHS